ncbi:hypothetical protein [Methanosarcina sp.]|uniref:hypothetical protein n=1 Tax=Methanosarcina sp. TaxID=2213 RepID=UPI002AB87A2B|nr:hypothetical protein [Methanosarcina sp.]MDY9924937.1 hypothetical protein [Methanosarcina sp.]
MRRESVIFIILLGIFLSAGCAENGTEEPEPVSPVETPVNPAEVPQPPAEIVESPENTPDPTPIENLTLTEPETSPETPAETPDNQAEARVVEVRIENFTFNPDPVTILPASIKGHQG